MSTTVAELKTELQYWIGEDADILYLINTAIRFIAKRLYVLDSEIVMGVMSVPIYDEVSYAAATIAFVENSSTADTITDSASQFVAESFAVDMPITTDSTTNPGPFRVSTVAVGTLTLHTDDDVTDEAAGSTITITSDDAYGFLPADFWGLFGKPYLDGKTYPLLQLPSTDVELQYTSAGLPHYYRIMGNKIYVTPNTSANYTIKADYFQKPTTLENTTDILPWDDLFNDVIYEIVINLFKKSGILVPELISVLNTSIDVVANKRGKKAPKQMGLGINYYDYE